MVSSTRPEQGQTDEGRSAEPVDPFTILIADDDRGSREALGDVLQDRGFRTVLAADGGEAVEIVQVQLVHLVLFDMHMPKLTGLEAVSLLRNTLRQMLPAVLMTADATTELLRQAFQAQVYSVIPKPVNTRLVVHTLAGALARVYGPAAGPPAAEPPKTDPAPPQEK